MKIYLTQTIGGWAPAISIIYADSEEEAKSCRDKFISNQPNAFGHFDIPDIVTEIGETKNYKEIERLGRIRILVHADGGYNFSENVIPSWFSRVSINQDYTSQYSDLLFTTPNVLQIIHILYQELERVEAFNPHNAFVTKIFPRKDSLTLIYAKDEVEANCLINNLVNQYPDFFPGFLKDNILEKIGPVYNLRQVHKYGKVRILKHNCNYPIKEKAPEWFKRISIAELNIQNGVLNIFPDTENSFVSLIKVFQQELSRVQMEDDIKLLASTGFTGMDSLFKLLQEIANNLRIQNIEKNEENPLPA
jgi:hypothetical protein